MQIFPRRGGLVPMGGGGSIASSRPTGVPTLSTGKLSNSVGYLQDFNSFSCGTSADTEYQYTVIAGTSSAGAVASAASAAGVLQLATSASSGDGVMIDANGGRTTTSGHARLLAAGQVDHIVQVRFNVNSNTTVDYGFGGVVSSLAVGTNWLTDPDTTLAAQTHWVITRHVGAYSGDNAGELVLRMYDTDEAISAVVASSVTAGTGTYHKVELHFTAAGAVNIYYDGTFVSTVTCPTNFAAATTAPMRFSAGIRLTGATTAKTLNIDCLYVEDQLTVTR